MRAVLLSLLFALAVFHLEAAPSSATATLQAANNAYQEQDYETAIDRYEQLIQQGYTSVALYHNLGNAYFRSEAYARAVLYYRRALRIAPRDQQLLQNLRLAQLELPGTVVSIKKSNVVASWLAVQERLSTKAWSIIGIVLLWIGLAGIARWQFGKNRQQRKVGFIGGIIVLLLCLLPFAFAYGRAQQAFFRKEAVVMVDESQLRVAPELESPKVQKAFKGDVVRILDQLNTWYKVRMSDTTEGWLPADQMTVI